MKKLLNTLYVMSEDAYLTLDGENVVVKKEQEIAGRFPLHNIESILCFSYAGASPAFIGHCVERNIGIAFFNPQGKFLARAVGRSYGNVLLRKEQYRISDDMQRGFSYAKNMIVGKVYNCRWSLERTCRDHMARVDAVRLKGISSELQEGLQKIALMEGTMDSLRGMEGELASRYFSIFDELIINQKMDFFFEGRIRRPTKDRVNALLSFTYTILANDCANALESIGLDSYVGFMHRDRPGRKSLALDLMEELRPIMADRFVLTLINTKMLNRKHFIIQQDETVLLNETGRKAFFSAWQNRKKEIITHPYLKEKMEWGLVPYVQALLLARTIRGDLEEYPPFLWK